MNIDSISETLRQYLTIRHPELAIHTPLNNGKLAVPYALLSVTAEEELIARNSTWNLALSMEVHSSAYDHPEASNKEWANELFTSVCGSQNHLNARATDFMVYSIRLSSIEEPEVKDNDFIQRANFRIIVQF